MRLFLKRVKRIVSRQQLGGYSLRLRTVDAGLTDGFLTDGIRSKTFDIIKPGFIAGLY